MYYEWRPYVPVARKLANARKYALRQAKKEKRELAPVRATARRIATKHWGLAWCDNLDQYSDFANRLPRGRTYLRNGSVVDLGITPGRIEAIVAGSEVYKVTIKIRALAAKTWMSLQRDCARSIHSLFDLLQGRFDEGVMQRLAQRGGLFPEPAEIDMQCSCPDYADVCKHLAAVMYGVGVRLDTSPELLFTLRNVDHLELISQAVAAENLEQSLAGSTGELAGSDLGELFGIDLDRPAEAETPAKASSRTTRRAKQAPSVPSSSAGPARRSKRRATGSAGLAPIKAPAAKASVVAAAPVSAEPATRPRKPRARQAAAKARPKRTAK